MSDKTKLKAGIVLWGTILIIILIFAQLVTETPTAHEIGKLSGIRQVTPWTKYGDDVTPHKSAVFCGQMNKGITSKEHCWVVTVE